MSWLDAGFAVRVWPHVSVARTRCACHTCLCSTSTARARDFLSFLLLLFTPCLCASAHSTASLARRLAAWGGGGGCC